MFEDAISLAILVFIIMLIVYTYEVTSFISMVKSRTQCSGQYSERLTAPSFRDADIAAAAGMNAKSLGLAGPEDFATETFAPYPSILSADVMRSDDQSDRAPRTAQPQRYNQRSSEDLLFNQINSLWVGD